MSKPVTNPTDTNKASEDELRGRIVAIFANSIGDVVDDTDDVIAIIRTEKLKLLAEVRSNLLEMRELKENRDDKGILWGSYDVVDLDDIQGLLTKLEAEL